MSFKFLNRFNDKNNHEENTTHNNNNSKQINSLLLAVPIYFYLEFFKIYYKSLILCFFLITGILLAYIWAPSSDISKNIPSLAASQSLGAPYIQNYNNYDDMLKLLQKMQETADFLQVKQQAFDRKTQALQQQIKKLQMKTTNGNQRILNEEIAQNMIREALSVYDADKLGLRGVDYALENFGGRILSISAISPKLTQKSYILFGIFNLNSYSNPRTIIQPEVQAGNCFEFYGSYGRIKIKLANQIFISAVTLEYVSTNLLTPEEISAAPKSFSLYGLSDETSLVGLPLGQFAYSIQGPPRQTFIITNKNEATSFQIIEFEILSNHGNEEYTCVYRLRVHGRLVK